MANKTPWWKRMISSKTDTSARRAPQMDPVSEGIAQEKRGDFIGALTSYRIALREARNQGDPFILQNIGICYMREQRTDEALKTFRRVLDSDPNCPGAQYGHAFCALKLGQPQIARQSLLNFLHCASNTESMSPYIAHAEQTLAMINDSRQTRGQGAGGGASRSHNHQSASGSSTRSTSSLTAKPQPQPHNEMELVGHHPFDSFDEQDLDERYNG